MPLRYEDRRFATPIKELKDASVSLVRGVVGRLDVKQTRRKNLHIATFEISDPTGTASVVLFGGPRSFSGVSEGSGIALYGATRRRGKIIEFENPDWTILNDGTKGQREQKNDWARILPVYPTVKGLSRKQLAGIIYACVTSPDLIVDDHIPEKILTERGFPSLKKAFMGVHAPGSPEETEPSRRRLAYQELYEIGKKIFEARAARKRKKAPQLESGADYIGVFVDSLPFALTQSQTDAINEISCDMRESSPMYRLLQGDVGSGKTIVSACAVMQCVKSGCQAAVLTPTTVLSAQFFAECARHLSPFGVRCAELTGGVPEKERASLLASLAGGELDVVVGTHALLGDDVAFKALGLVVIDEQHRFGVLQRDRMENKRFSRLSPRVPHTLMMSATPIPRTLSMALYGDVDSTVIAGKPPGRAPVVTKIVSDNHVGDIYSFMAERVNSGERCCWVCRSIGDDGEFQSDDASVLWRADDIGEKLSKDIPGLRVERLHGRINSDEKRSAIERFSRGQSQVLVSTTVIEVGVDIPEAGVIVIEGASSYGLSQLHQMRGRVGRGERRGVCILLDSVKNIKKHGRLDILKNCDDGFQIAEEDLKLRGAGEIAGLRQHGDIPLKAADLPRDAGLLELARSDIEVAQCGAHYRD
jgi:ATP-dependent DNA helicase RecG